MKTTFDINDILYPIINVSSVKSTIDGRVYRNKKPLKSELQDIVILPLSNYVGDEIINDATFMVNCFCKNFIDGMPDIAKLRATFDAIATVIEAYGEAMIGYKPAAEAEHGYKPAEYGIVNYKKTKSSNNYYVFDITNQILLQDTDQISMSYINIRLQCFIEKGE